jgi:hypothetical protein
MPIAWTKLIPVALVLAVLALGAWLTAQFFNTIPPEWLDGQRAVLAIDWRTLYRAIEGGRLIYGEGYGLFNPPWAALVVLPLGLLTMRESWGVLTFVTLAVLVIAVPRPPRNGWLWLAGVLLLVLSFPSLRLLADGNLEALPILGIVLVLYAFPRAHPPQAPAPYLRWTVFGAMLLGLLLTTAKPQVVFMFVGVLALYFVLAWQPRQWLALGAGTALVVFAALVWQGQAWFTAMIGIAERNSLMDVSLLAALQRPQTMPQGAVWALWGLVALVTSWLACLARPRGTDAPYKWSRALVGLCLTASLLLSPYSAGNSLLTVLAAATVPLLMGRVVWQRWLAVGLLVLVNGTWLVQSGPNARDTQAYYTTFVLVVHWLAFGVVVWLERPARALPSATTTTPA